MCKYGTIIIQDSRKAQSGHIRGESSENNPVKYIQCAKSAAKQGKSKITKNPLCFSTWKFETIFKDFLQSNTCTKRVYEIEINISTMVANETWQKVG